MAKKESKVNPELEKAIKKLMDEVMKDPQASLTDKVKVIDRAIKFEQMKQKIQDDGMGSGFYSDDDYRG